jgi:hypothetical protein
MIVNTRMNGSIDEVWYFQKFSVVRGLSLRPDELNTSAVLVYMRIMQNKSTFELPAVAEATALAIACAVACATAEATTDVDTAPLPVDPAIAQTQCIHYGVQL